MAQIARSIARTLGLNEDLTEAIALAHDIGHTPFGHSGEDVLNEIMEDEGGFEHNFQSIRVLDELEEKYPDFPGLNLSWETREGIVKHTTDYDNPKIKDFDPGIPPTLEAQIVNVADEIAYNSHDVDDGVTSRILTIDGLKQTLIWNEIKKHMDMDKFNHLSFEMKKYHMTRALINTQVTALVENTVKNLEENKISSVGDVRNYGQLIIKFDDDMEKMHRDFKDFLYKNFYKHHKVIRMEYKAGKIIKDLFDIYYMRGDRKDSRGVQTSILPPEIAKRLKNDSLKRVICDYIAAMTDRSILDEYHKLFDPYEKV